MKVAIYDPEICIGPCSQELFRSCVFGILQHMHGGSCYTICKNWHVMNMSRSKPMYRLTPTRNAYLVSRPMKHYEQYSLITPMSLWRYSLRYGAPNLKNRIELLYLQSSDGIARHYLPTAAIAGMFITSLLLFGAPQKRSL